MRGESLNFLQSAHDDPIVRGGRNQYPISEGAKFSRRNRIANEGRDIGREVCSAADEVHRRSWVCRSGRVMVDGLDEFQPTNRRSTEGRQVEERERE